MVLRVRCLSLCKCVPALAGFPFFSELFPLTALIPRPGGSDPGNFPIILSWLWIELCLWAESHRGEVVGCRALAQALVRDSQS